MRRTVQGAISIRMPRAELQWYSQSGGSGETPAPTALYFFTMTLAAVLPVPL